MSNKLTLKQTVFIDETLATLNPTAGAMKAYDLGAKGGSKTLAQKKHVARTIASENMAKPAILEDFQKRLALLDDSKIVEQFYEIALFAPDVRSRIQAGVEILKLKQRYPKESIDIDLGLKRTQFTV